MNKIILNTGIQLFINKNLNTDISSVLLKKPFFDEVTNQELAEQIQSKNKCKDKLPTWYSTPNIYYPNKLNIEQTSSETTAAYKANLVSGNLLADITGGLGVDSFSFSKQVKKVIHCELNPTLSEIAQHNFSQLNTANIETVIGDGLQYLQKTDKTFSWIYADPSRRNEARNKVFLLDDCLPNIPANIDLLFSKTAKVLLKTSPLLDISSGLKSLSNTAQVHIVAVNNEVKELLWVLHKNLPKEQDVNIRTVNIKKEKTEEFQFFLSEEKNSVPIYGQPETYLYEPNPAILKSGGFNSIASRLGVNKLHPNTHLYTSHLKKEFPGRVFKITQVLPFSKSNVKSHITGQKMNLSTRNFPETVDSVRKKHKIKDGGENYIFLTTNYLNERIIILSKKN